MTAAPTRTELADRAGLSTPTVDRLLDGRIGHPDTVRLICAIITAALTPAPAPPPAPTPAVVRIRPGDTWRLDAACRDMGPAVFYPRGRDWDAQVADARRVCRSCPVREQCGDHADTVGETHGIWGGEERDVFRGGRRTKGAA